MRSGHLLAACLFVAVSLPLAAQRPSLDPIPVVPLAQKLGIRLLPSTIGELEPGHSTTMALDDSSKIAGFGIKGMHTGARVTVSYVGPSRIRVDVDEMEPGPRNATVTLIIAPTGELAVAAPAGKQPTSVPATGCCD